MLKHIKVKGYKCLDQCDLPLAPLILLAGPNSSGKSTLIQAILLTWSGIKQTHQPYLKEIVKPYARFEDDFCRQSNADYIDIELTVDSKVCKCRIETKGLGTHPETMENFPGYEEKLFYLCAGRTGPEEISPLNREISIAGNSFVLKLLVLCLTGAPGDILLLENPEIHLHPGAQSRLGNLFSFLSAKGVQIIAETHCEHLINRIRYEVYKKQIHSNDVLIHYKKNNLEPFEVLKINPGGHFCDTTGKEKSFPGGFFDSTLMELLEIS
jgi:predicted ATPase